MLAIWWGVKRLRPKLYDSYNFVGLKREERNCPSTFDPIGDRHIRNGFVVASDNMVDGEAPWTVGRKLGIHKGEVLCAPDAFT